MGTRDRQQHWVRAVVYVLVLLVVVGMVLSAVGTASAAAASTSAAPWGPPAPGSSTQAPGRQAPAAWRQAAPSARAAPGSPGSLVVVLGTHNLTWGDLLALAGSEDAGTARSASAVLDFAAANEPLNLAVRTPADRTCPADGWLTLAAGTRVRAVGGSGTCAWPGARAPGQPQTSHQASQSPAASDRSSPSAAATSEGPTDHPPAASDPAVPSAAPLAATTSARLSSQLSRAGVPVAAVGRGAELALGTQTGTSPEATTGTALDKALTGTGLVLVDTTAPEGSGAASRDPDDAASLASLAQALVTTATRAPAGTRVIIISLADDTDPGPQVAVLPTGTTSPRGTSGALLVGASTHQPGLIQLTDLAPTLVEGLTGRTAEGLDGQALSLPASSDLAPVPAGSSGLGGGATPAPAAQAATSPDSSDTSTSAGSTGSLEQADPHRDRLGRLADDALHARASQRTVIPAGLLLTGTAALLLVWAALALRDRRGGFRPASQGRSRPARPSACLPSRDGAAGRHVLSRGSRPAGTGPRHRATAVSWAAAVVAAGPLGALLVNLLPWWRVGAQDGTPSPWVVPAALALVSVASAGLVGGILGLVVLTRRLAARQRPRHPDAGAQAHQAQAQHPAAQSQEPHPSCLHTLTPGLVAFLLSAATALSWLADAACGAPLAFNGPLGMNAVVAGRFYGVSNTAFALATSALLVFLAVTWQILGGGRRTAWLLTGTLGGAALLVDAAPQLGADVGGTLALLPALVALGAGLSGTRLGRLRWLGVVAASVAVAAALAAVDYLRPAGQRTHLGHLAAQVADGTVLTTLSRKALALVSPFMTSGVALASLLAGLALALALAPWARREHRSWTAGTSPYAWATAPTQGAGEAAGPARPWLRPVLQALAVLTCVAVLVNDSGITVAGFALAGSAPALLALVLSRPVKVPRPAHEGATGA